MLLLAITHCLAKVALDFENPVLWLKNQNCLANQRQTNKLGKPNKRNGSIDFIFDFISVNIISSKCYILNKHHFLYFLMTDEIVTIREELKIGKQTN